MKSGCNKAFQSNFEALTNRIDKANTR